GRLELALAARPDSVLLHQFSHPLLAHSYASSQQLLPHPRPAILALAFGVHSADVHEQRIVAEPPRIRLARSTPVFVVSAGTHAQHFAAHRHRPLLALPLDPRVLQSRCFAQHAVALPKMSPSIRSPAFSARTRGISIRSGPT